MNDSVLSSFVSALCFLFAGNHAVVNIANSVKWVKSSSAGLIHIMSLSVDILFFMESQA